MAKRQSQRTQKQGTILGAVLLETVAVFALITMVVVAEDHRAQTAVEELVRPKPTEFAPPPERPRFVSPNRAVANSTIGSTIESSSRKTIWKNSWN